ncbi:replication-relaxation family protein [Actinokineospora cianjurensis]|uniref:Protein involved in plasmid replication-relaxation n=1 Tax=Actinokineospora cianjurensis TaxID=585224 RepID=A0A421BC34_9PSEU|nr:replication-relaxation family protein [Actinokineospora cianjurensis]RLK61932.1 protein involved in plasmid replication-relaxation [Actinokineospora cianjurensis]
MTTNATPQRALRGHAPTRPNPRAAVSGEHHARLASRLTQRDRWLAHMLWEHKVLTTHQIVELAWSAAARRTANERLRKLYQWRVLDRFQPFVTTGSAPMHYVLDIAGATALAYEHGLDPAELGYRHDAAIGIAHSLRLAHTIGCNGFFTSLSNASRTDVDTGLLTTWWSEARCRRLWGDIVRPDGYGRWAEHGTEIEFFVEFDFGTETLRILAAKLHDYHRLAVSTGIITPLLLWLPTAHREANVRRALADAHATLPRPELVPLATSSPQQPATSDDPAADRWLPLPASVSSSRRVRLAEFASKWPRRTPAADLVHRLTTAVPNSTRSRLDSPSPTPPDGQTRQQWGAA